MRRFPYQFVIASLAVGILLLHAANIPPMGGIEENFINWLAANSTSDHGNAPVTLVEINDNSLIDYPWPWSPLNYALFLDAALQFKAGSASVEPVLTWDESKMTNKELQQLPQFEKILHENILKTPKLELGAELGFPEDPDLLPAMQPMPVFRNVTGAAEAVPEYTVVESEPGEDIRLTAALGFTNVPPTESTARHAPLVFRYRGQIVPSFALEAMMLWYGVTPEDVQINLGSDIRLAQKLTIPINAAGSMLLDWKQPYDRVEFEDLVLAEDQLQGKHATVINPELLDDRMLILARTDARSQTLLLPTGRMGSPGEIFAEAVATAESNAFARPAGRTGSLMVLIFGAAVSWFVARLGLRKSAVAIFGFAVFYLLLCLTVFATTRVALPLSPMLGLTIFVAAYRLGGGRTPRKVRPDFRNIPDSGAAALAE